MAKRTGPTNVYLQNLILDLKRLSTQKNVKLWKRIAKDLSKPTRQRREVNIYRINKYCKGDEIAIVPGKVLSMGELDKKLTIAAWNFSDKAKDKINKSGKAISIQELMKTNPEGKKVRIIG